MEDEEREEEDRPLFEVHQVGPVKFYEAAEGVDWLSLFPSDPRGGPDPENKLIDLPTAVEPPAPPVSAATPLVDEDVTSIAPAPRRSIEVLYPPGPKRIPRMTIAISIAGVIAAATFLYWLVAPPAVREPAASSVAAANPPSPPPPSDPKAAAPDQFTMEALAPPAPLARPTQTPAPRLAPPPKPRATPTIQAAPAAAELSRPPRPVTTAVTPAPTPAISASPSPPSSTATTAALTAAPATPTPTPRPSVSPAPTPASSPALTPASTPIASSAAPPPSNTTATETAAVRGVLDAYRAAYESQSAETVKSVWPGANASALDRAFKQMDSQSLDFYSCGIELNGAAAEATCTGAITFVPKVGGKTPRVEPHRWTFYLVRQSDRWIIDHIVAR